MRFLSPVFLPFTNISPFHFSCSYANDDLNYRTVLTPYQSARMGYVWPGRIDIDVSGLYQPDTFQNTYFELGRIGLIKIGRDIHLKLRTQSEFFHAESFEEFCGRTGLSTVRDEERLRRALFTSFEHGSAGDHPLKRDPVWQAVEAWRINQLRSRSRAPRKRLEIRVLETPFAIPDLTPYTYLKALLTFLELLFIYLSEDPKCTRHMDCGEIELSMAKKNEIRVNQFGLDAPIHWLPTMTSTTPREILKAFLFPEIKSLAKMLEGGREEDLYPIEEMIYGGKPTPSVRLRQEVLKRYVKPGKWDQLDPFANFILPDQELTYELLFRNRETLEDELNQIRDELPSLPSLDQVYIGKLMKAIA
jgi:hypothetical protein